MRIGADPHAAGEITVVAVTFAPGRSQCGKARTFRHGRDSVRALQDPRIGPAHQACRRVAKGGVRRLASKKGTELPAALSRERNEGRHRRRREACRKPEEDFLGRVAAAERPGRGEIAADDRVALQILQPLPAAQIVAVAEGAVGLVEVGPAGEAFGRRPRTRGQRDWRRRGCGKGLGELAFTTPTTSRIACSLKVPRK